MPAVPEVGRVTNGQDADAVAPAVDTSRKRSSWPVPAPDAGTSVQTGVPLVPVLSWNLNVVKSATSDHLPLPGRPERHDGLRSAAATDGAPASTEAGALP